MARQKPLDQGIAQEWLSHHPRRGHAGGLTVTSAISDFVVPRPALTDCLTAMIVRDTRGCALDHAQRFNFLPAWPWPIVSWMFAGDGHLIDQPDQVERPWTGARAPSRFFFYGAQLRPFITWNPAEVYVISLGFYPDAFSAMTGLDLSLFTGSAVPAEEALPQPMLEACRNFFDSVPREGVERSFSVLQDKIEVMWAGMRPAETRSRFTADWSRNVVHRATATGSGRSTRQIARRVKSWTGVGERDLQLLGQLWRLLFNPHEGATRKGDVEWAAIAAAFGFTDQAHMIKRMKQLTGFTPKQLHESARYDEAFWYYRLIARVADEYLARQKGQ
jgi:AraC-like DNA-binding protein